MDKTKNRILHIVLIGLAIFVVMLTRLLITQINYSTARASDLTLENILAGINKERALRNIPTLKADSRLSQAAQSKSDDMQARHYFSHTDPEGNYIWNKIVAAGYTPYVTLGENLAIEFYNTESLVQAWMNSPTHRANVLNEAFEDQGMGLNLGTPADGQYYSAITNTFGTLQPALAVKPESAHGTPASVAVKPKSKTVSPSPPTSPPQTAAPKPAAKTPTAPTSSQTQNLTRTQGSSLIDARASSSNASSSADIKTSSPYTGLAKPAQKQNDAKKNQSLLSVLALILALLMLIDLKFLAKENSPSLDKKINNFSLLILSIIFIIVIYWL